MSMRNGVDFSTGTYLEGPVTLADLTSSVRGETPLDKAEEKRLKKHVEVQKPHLGPIEEIEPHVLAETGWGVIFEEHEDPAVIKALRPLLDWRKAEAGRFYKEFSGETGFRKGQTKEQFLGGADGYGPVDPANGVPYYLLIVGSPEKIPYSFQYLVDVQYAVGRIEFDTPAEYRLYAENVVAAEKENLTLPKRAVFFGVSNPGDSVTAGSAKGLIKPMAVKTEAEGWTVECPPVEETTRARLKKIVSDAPSLMLIACHGCKMSMQNPKDQKALAGALLCQDYEFPSNGPDGKPLSAPITMNHLFKAADVPESARLHGSIILLFACYGAGMPKFEDFVLGETREQVAPEAFVAALPRRLLAHPGGGALAVIGHVERAWSTSFEGARADREQVQTFWSTWLRLMKGYRVGYAMEYFNIKYAEMSTALAIKIRNDGVIPDKPPEAPELVSLWEAQHDARNYCVIGDPAVRIQHSETPSGPVAIRREAVGMTENGDETRAVESVRAERVPEQFGFLPSFGSSETEPSGLAIALEKMVGRIGATLERVVDGLTTVEVATYTSDNLANVEYKDGQFIGAKLRARTRLGMDGKTVNLVPERDGKVDEALWSVHMASVDKAVLNRTEMIRLATNAASSLLAVIKK